MSVEEDTELRDLVSKTLENNGVLAKIRAELRASVFLALEEQESNSAPFENKALKEYLKSSQAALGLCIVREFLEYLELDFTLSVYNTETSHGKGYEYSGRNKLVKDLKIKNLNGKKGPLLSHILQIAQESGGLPVDVKEETPTNSPVHTKPSPGGGPFHNVSHEGGASVDSPNVSLTPLDRTFTADGPTVKGILSLSSQSESSVNVGSKPDSNSKDGALVLDKNTKSPESDSVNVTANNQKSLLKNSSSKEIKEGAGDERKQNFKGDHIQTKPVKTETKNPMTSLNDLPPLDGLQGRRNLNSTSSINFAGLGLQDEYEEDFHSSDSSAVADKSGQSHSHSQKSSNKYSTHKKEKSLDTKVSNDNVEKETSDKATNSPVGSVSEDIDDDTNSAIDDLLNSNTSTENTVDNTISHIRSAFADYIEDI